MEQADEGAPFRFDLGLWREFVQAMERHRFISCSRCLLAEFGLVEEDDDTVAARDGEIVPVLHIEADATRGLIRAHAVPDLRAALARGDGPDRITALLRAQTGLGLILDRPGEDGLPVLTLAHPTPVVADEGDGYRRMRNRLRALGCEARDDLAVACAPLGEPGPVGSVTR